jgi:adenylosuccinate lyase
MHRRVQVEVEWFIALSDAGLPSSSAAVRGRARGCAAWCSASRRPMRRPSRTSRRPPTTTSRRSSTGSRPLQAGHAELKRAAEFVHFACTSEDINNTSHALMLKAAREQVLLPALDRLIARLRRWRRHGRRCRCSAAPTARPPARPRWARRSPTWWRGCTARARIAAVPLLAKMNGAVGNYNAHLAAWPDIDWEAFRAVVEERLGLKLQPVHHPDRAARLHGRAVRRLHARPTPS